MNLYGAIIDKINEAVATGDAERKALGYSLLGEYGEAALLVGVPRADLVEMNKRLTPEPVTRDGDDCTDSCCA